MALAALTHWSVFHSMAEQLEHVPWDGFRFYDMIFPLFLFIAGVAFPFSFAKRRSAGESLASIDRHVVFRGIVLVVLGILYNNGISFEFAELRYGSVLGRIGLAWMFAALLFVHLRLETRLTCFAVLLLGYWLLLRFTLAPDLGASDPFSMEGNFASYVDRLFMPGKLYLGIHDPEGFFSTLPAIGTAMLGMFTGEFLRSPLRREAPWTRVLWMLAASVLLMAAGWLWSFAFPLNKNLWSSSFVLWVGGLSLLLLTLFHAVIDVLGYRSWAFFFTVIGLNPITIYLAERIIGLDKANEFFFDGLGAVLPSDWQPLIRAVGYVAIGWLFLYWLYRNRIFLKV